MLLTPLLLAAASAADLPVEAGAGLFFNAGGTFMSAPTDDVVDGFVVPTGGWGGYGNGGGLALEARVFGAVGLELDLVRRSDVAQSQYTINGTVLRFTATQGAWHLPILLKFVVPVGIVRPNLFGGGELVFPGSPSITQPDALSTTLAAHTEAYKAWAFGLGLEIVPPIEPIDLHFPISFRGAYNTGVGSSAAERADYTLDPGSNLLTEIDHKTVWQWHASVTVGATWFFL